MKLPTSTHTKLFVTYSGVLAFATVLVAFFMLNPTVSDTSATTSFNVNHSATGYTLSLELIGSNPGTVALSADTSTGGTWVAGKQTVRGTTNSPAGYQLYLSTTSASNALTGSDDDSNTIPAGGGTYSSPTTLAVNRWGYAIPDQTGYDGAFSGDYTISSDGTISSSTTWATMPVASAPVLVDTVSGQPAGATTTKDLNIYYGAAADIGLVSDTYLGTVLYSAISDTSSTGTESASINPSSQDVTDANVSVDITTPLYTTTDLTTSDVTATIGGATCPVTAVTRNPAGSSNPNAVVVTCTAPTSATTGKKDVVVSISKFGKSYTITNGYEYVDPAPSNITELENLQQLAEYPEACTNTTVGVSADIPDARDNTTYKIAKLADGKCWMLDNLALNLTSYTVHNMNENNTHASNTTLNYLRGTSTRDPSTDPDGNYATAGVSNWTQSTYSYSAPLVNLYYKDTIPSDATSQAGQYKVGGYYNYCAATAGSYCYGDGTSYGTSSGNATEDICPKGWRLPSGNTSGEFSALAYEIYGSTGSTSDPTAYANYRSALHLPLSGYINSGGSPGNRGSDGLWWSSTRGSNYNMYYLYVGTSGIYPASNNNRHEGYPIRCTSS